MRLVKKTALMVALWLCVVTLLVTTCSGATAWSLGQDEVPENHFVIMYDMSWSMDNADDRLKGMVADFLLKVPQWMMPYKVAVIPFAGQCPQTDILENTENEEGSWWEIQTGNGETREKIKDALSQLTYTGSYTDIEGALRTCAETLTAMRKDGGACNQTVLFITDGLIDLPGNGGDSGTKSRIDNIIASGGEVPGIAEDFPDDCKFWAIMPDEATKNSFLTYDAGGNILTYNGLKVEEDQQAGIRSVLSCLEDFCSRLNELGREGMGIRAGTIPMNWTKDTFDHFKKAYKDFFQSLWDTTTVTREQVELDRGFEFYVPDGTTEVNVTVMPEIEDPDDCRLAAERLAGDGGLLVMRDKEPYSAECSGSIYTVNVKLIDPPGGVYYLLTFINQKCSFTLDFLTYSNLKIVTSEQSITKALGSTVELDGSIADTTGRLITDDTARSITLEACVSGKEGGDEDRIPIELNSGRFQYSFTANRVGDSFITLYATYDDSDNPVGSNGVSKFGCRETIAITVPEVSYTGSAVRRFFIDISLELRPYSDLPKGQTDVPAEAAKKYLNDAWVVQLRDDKGDQIGSDIPMEVSNDGAYFVLECKDTGAETAVMVNRTTGETIEVSIPSPRLLIILCIVAATLVILATVVIIIMLFQRKVTVSIRWNGETEVLYLSRDGSPQSGSLGGELVTAWVEKESGQVTVRLDGLTRRADIVGHSCDIDL